MTQAVTDLYVSAGLPDYYVNVFFFPIQQSLRYVAGKEASRVIWIEIIHVARNWDGVDLEGPSKFKEAVNRVTEPYVRDDIHFEYVVIEGPAALWQINGIDPPESFGPEQQYVATQNKKLLDDLHQRLLSH
ncbi:uncharacterized protein Triagg1_7781 [Trichoderma aggressivum f. europaeum]|uniref:Tautomerase cis-CaaD-like domain-containing protein n=1 Tax=Trichoderma aggressivum f. europaeum TaxID=173218 RepID=A0AAE1M2L5_9HYPO|nr:hypothetical protein Triagg1_7781 [Trichoderma aggressivum f. europaeum]